MDYDHRVRAWLEHNELAGALAEGVALGLIEPVDKISPLSELVDELRRLNDGLEYDRAIARWQRGEGKHPDD